MIDALWWALPTNFTSFSGPEVRGGQCPPNGIGSDDRLISQRHQSSRRSGLVSVAVLIALFVIGLVCAGLLKVAFARRAEAAMNERRLQAEWLAESGLDRAVARLNASADNTGETWEVSAEDLGGRGAATVAIEVEKVTDRPDRRKVRIQADYPTGSSLRCRKSRETIVAIKSSSR